MHHHRPTPSPFPLLPLRRARPDGPCPRLLAEALSLRADAAEVAHQMHDLAGRAGPQLARLLERHVALILASTAAELRAHGQEVLGAVYARLAAVTGLDDDEAAGEGRAA